MLVGIVVCWSVCVRVLILHFVGQCVLERWHVQVKAGGGGASKAGEWMETERRRAEEEREGWLLIVTIIRLSWWRCKAVPYKWC